MSDVTSFNAKTKPLSIALMLVVFLAAMESTITALATPTITRDLAGFDLMSFIFSSYLLMAAITTPVFGRLADMIGRKKVLLSGIVIFLVGCILCGISQSMVMLIVFRALQGIGAGAIFTLSYTIVGDVYPLSSRGTIMGALSSVWGISGLLGPILGGFLIDALSWHWVFFINIPFGILSIFLLSMSLKEMHVPQPKQQRKKDFSGLFTRLTVLVNVVTFLACISMVGIDVYVVLFLQTVLGYSPTIAGLSMLPMAISWFFMSLYMGKLLIRFDARVLVVASGVLQLISGALFILLNETSGLPIVIFSAFMGGVSMGGLLSSTTMIIQESVGYAKRGTAMGINSFIKSMGQTVGISVLGIFLNMRLASFFLEQGYGEVDASTLLQITGETGVTSEAPAEFGTNVIVTALDTGIDLVFWIMFGCTIALVLIALFIPKVQFGKDGASETLQMSEKSVSDSEQCEGK